MKYIHFRNIGLILLLALGSFSCKSYKNEPKQDLSNLKSDLIDEAIKANFNTLDSVQIIPNQQGNWILYLAETTTSPANPNNNINLVVYNKINKKLIYKNKFDNAHVNWFNNDQLSLTITYGIIVEKDGDNIKDFIIDVNTKEITELKKNKNKPKI